MTNPADSGAGSLRGCIESADNLAGADAIHFELPGSAVRTILLETALPDITDPVMIDGYTQPGSRANTLDWDSDAQLLVRLDGVKLTNGLPYALTLKAGGCSVRGLIVVRFSGGIKIGNVSSNTIAGNWIGLDWDGVARGMAFDGTWIRLAIQAMAAGILAGGVAGTWANLLLAIVGFAAVLVLTNVWNFMDGINGIAASQAALVAAGMAFIVGGIWGWLALALVAACVGFIPFNFPKARIFLGDVGSGALGFVLAMLFTVAFAHRPGIWG